MVEECVAEQFREAVYGVAPVALRVAVTLGVIDNIGDNIVSVNDLAKNTDTAINPLRKLLRFMAARGVLSQPISDHFSLTELGRTLLLGHPSGLREWLDSSGIGVRMDRAIGHLDEALTSGRSPYREVNGKDFYDDMGRSDDDRSFDQMRDRHAQSYASELANAYQWPEAGVVVDVGGGTGSLLAEVLRHRPTLRGVLLDLPNAVAAGTERFDKADLTDRFTPAPGNFFEYIPPGGQVYLLVNVLHNWSDDQVIAILRNCAQACAVEGGEVLIVERVEEDLDPSTFTAMDLRMFLLTGGEERSFRHYRSLAERAGLSLFRGPSLSSELCVLVGRQQAVNSTISQYKVNR